MLMLYIFVIFFDIGSYLFVLKYWPLNASVTFACRNQAKMSDAKEEAAKAAAKAEKEKKDAMANIDINNYASLYTHIFSLPKSALSVLFVSFLSRCYFTKPDIFGKFRRVTGIRGLMRGMATLPQGNLELLVVRDKAGRPPGELGLSKSMECDIFPFGALTLLLG